ncbi:unnamed protein product, partial [Brassica oleracea]
MHTISSLLTLSENYRKETFIHDTCGKSERREEERGFGFVIWFCSLSFSETSPSSSSLSEAIFSVYVVPRQNGGIPCLRGSSASLNRVSPWLVDETKSLSLRGSSIDRRRTSLSLCLLEFIADWVRFGLAVALVNGEGGLCRRLSANRSGINSRLICSVERVL